MGILKSGARRLADVVARRVARNHLFEQPGERAPTPPLPPRPQPPPPQPPPPQRTDEPEGRGASPRPAPPGAPAAGGAPGPRPELPTAGCVQADLDLLRRVLGAGGGVRVVNHWATWCEPCVEELPALRRLAGSLPAGASLIGVSWDLFDPRGGPDEVAAEVATFATTHGMDWASLLVTADADAFFEAMGVRWPKIPQTWVVADDGRVVHRIEGVVDDESLGALHEAIAGARP